MKLKGILKAITAASLALTFAACDSGSTDDPATAGREDLNPPGRLDSTTGDGSLTLWWSAGNVEEDFKGYYVFAVKTESVVKKPTYPAGVDPQLSGYPRCLDNTATFEGFGFPATERDCEGAKEEAAPAEGEDALYGQMLQDGEEEGDAAADEGSEKLTNWVPCDGVSGDLSLPVEGGATTMQKCTIKKYYDTEAKALGDITNGQTYKFMVVAVMGDDLSTISWTSNVVEDTPSTDAVAPANITLAQNQFVKVEFTIGDNGYESAEVSAAAACADGQICGLSTTNATAVSSGKPTIFIGRQLANGYKQRVFISSSTDTTSGAVLLQPRGPQTYDAYAGSKSHRIPGDQAASTYASAGVKWIVYNDQIFDFQITGPGGTAGSDSFHGKIYVGDVSFAGDNTSDATMNVGVVIQPQPGVYHYLNLAE